MNRCHISLQVLGHRTWCERDHLPARRSPIFWKDGVRVTAGGEKEGRPDRAKAGQGCQFHLLCVPNQPYSSTRLLLHGAELDKRESDLEFDDIIE